MQRTFADNTALKIMANKLRGKPQEAVYELTDAELAVLGAQLPVWTVAMSHVFAGLVGDVEKASKIISAVIALPEPERIALADAANTILEDGETPSHRQYAAFMLSNHSDEITIADEIKRRENVN